MPETPRAKATGMPISMKTTNRMSTTVMAVPAMASEASQHLLRTFIRRHGPTMNDGGRELADLPDHRQQHQRASDRHADRDPGIAEARDPLERPHARRVGKPRPVDDH